MQGAAAALMAGVESAEKIDHLRTPYLADHETVGTHPEGLPDEVVEAYGTRSFDVGRPGFEAYHMGMGRAELGRVLHQYESLGRVDEGEQRAEQGRLAAAGAAGDQEGDPRIDQRREQGGSGGRNGAGLD